MLLKFASPIRITTGTTMATAKHKTTTKPQRPAPSKGRADMSMWARIMSSLKTIFTPHARMHGDIIRTLNNVKHDINTISQRVKDLDDDLSAVIKAVGSTTSTPMRMMQNKISDIDMRMAQIHEAIKEKQAAVRVGDWMTCEVKPPDHFINDFPFGDNAIFTAPVHSISHDRQWVSLGTKNQWRLQWLRKATEQEVADALKNARVKQDVIGTIQVLELEKSTGRETQPADDIGGLDLAVEVTGLSRRTIYKLTHRRKIPHCKVGGRLYFRRTELVQWIAAGRRPMATQVA